MKFSTKQDLRERGLTLLRSQREEERLKKSLSIKDRLFANNDILNAKTILFYASFDGEVNTFPMIKEARQLGKRVALPRIDKEAGEFTPELYKDSQELESGPFGIKQPKSDPAGSLAIEDVDAIVVPGVAFDLDNYRLGRGGGFYDRFLSKIHSRVPSIGLAFDFQCVDQIPELGDHDIPVSCVVSG